jgi:hypothetical protein
MCDLVCSVDEKTTISSLFGNAVSRCTVMTEIVAGVDIGNKDQVKTALTRLIIDYPNDDAIANSLQETLIVIAEGLPLAAAKDAFLNASLFSYGSERYQEALLSALLNIAEEEAKTSPVNAAETVLESTHHAGKFPHLKERAMSLSMTLSLKLTV